MNELTSWPFSNAFRTHLPRDRKAAYKEAGQTRVKPIEAYLAMKDFKLYREKTVWTWTDKRLEMADMTTYSGDLRSSTVTCFKSSEKVIAKCTFVDGLVDTIEH